MCSGQARSSLFCQADKSEEEKGLVTLTPGFSVQFLLQVDWCFIGNIGLK